MSYLLPVARQFSSGIGSRIRFISLLVLLIVVAVSIGASVNATPEAGAKSAKAERTPFDLVAASKSQSKPQPRTRAQRRAAKLKKKRAALRRKRAMRSAAALKVERTVDKVAPEATAPQLPVRVGGAGEFTANLVVMPPDNKGEMMVRDSQVAAEINAEPEKPSTIRTPEGELSIRLLGVPTNAPPAWNVEDDASLFVAPRPGTNLVIRPVSDGLEQVVQAKADSDFSITWELKLPGLSALSSTQDGGIVVIDENGQEQAKIDLPRLSVTPSDAWADASFSFQGSRLTLHVRAGGDANSLLAVTFAIRSNIGGVEVSDRSESGEIQRSTVDPRIAAEWLSESTAEAAEKGAQEDAEAARTARTARRPKKRPSKSVSASLNGSLGTTTIGAGWRGISAWVTRDGAALSCNSSARSRLVWKWQNKRVRGKVVYDMTKLNGWNKYLSGSGFVKGAGFNTRRTGTSADKWAPCLLGSFSNPPKSWWRTDYEENRHPSVSPWNFTDKGYYPWTFKPYKGAFNHSLTDKRRWGVHYYDHWYRHICFAKTFDHDQPAGTCTRTVDYTIRLRGRADGSGSFWTKTTSDSSNYHGVWCYGVGLYVAPVGGEFSPNGHSPQSCPAPQARMGSEDDSGGEPEEIIDEVPPETTISSPLNGDLLTPALQTISMASNETGTFECSVDAEEFFECNAPWNNTFSEGFHTVQVRAVDEAGNIDPTPAQVTFTIDSIPPDTSIGKVLDRPWSTKQNTPPTRSLTGDVNGDSFEDVVEYRESDRSLSVRKSVGGSFTGAEEWARVPVGTQTVLLGDLNGDKNDDIVAYVGTSTTTDDGVWHALLSDGHGFGESQIWRTGFGVSAESHGRAFLADVNGDLKADAIAQTAMGTFNVALSSGTGFGTPSAWGGLGYLMFESDNPVYGQTFFEDMNADGKADAVWSSESGWTVSLSNGSAFGAQASYSITGGSGKRRFLADVNADKRADAIYFDTAAGRWTVAINNGSGFAAPATWRTGFGTDMDLLRFGDVDGDGRSDLITRDKTGGWRVALAMLTKFGPGDRWLESDNEASVRMHADVNGDGKADSITYSIGPADWSVGLSQGGEYGPTTVWRSSHGRASAKVVAADVNGDARADAVSYYTNGEWRAALSNGSGFAKPTTWCSECGPDTRSQYLADINGDNKSDAVFVDDTTNIWHVALSNGAGFEPPVPSLYASAGNDFTADVDGDGDDDAITLDDITGDWKVGLSSGSSIGAASTWRAGFGLDSSDQFVADATGDGRADLITYWETGGVWRVAASTGTGFSATDTEWTSGFGGANFTVAAGDATGDSRADISIFFVDTGQWFLARSNGTGFLPLATQTVSRERALTFRSSDPIEWFDCSVDGGAYEDCTSPYVTGGLADGTHTISVRARDRVGNFDLSPSLTTFVVDMTPPDTVITAGAAGSVSEALPFRFSSPDGGVSFECRLDGGEFEPCASPKAYSALVAGAHTLEVRAIDAGSNTDPTPATRTFTIDPGAPALDTTPPDTAIDDGPAPDGAIAPAEVKFKFSSEPGATFECRFDGSAWASCVTPKSLGVVVTPGQHSFSVRASDAIGNPDPSPATRLFVVDTAPPSATISAAFDAIGGRTDSTVSRAADVNGDGTEDLIAFSATAGAWEVTLVGSDGMEIPRPWAIGFGSNSLPLLGDVNGDGKADAVAVTTAGTWTVAISDGQKFNVQPTPWATGLTYSNSFLGDVSGDGRADLVSVSGNQWRVRLSTGSGFDSAVTTTAVGPLQAGRFLADVTGDGKDDAIFRINGSWQVAPSLGAGFGADFSWTAAVTAANAYPVDTNVDGKADLVSSAPGASFGTEIQIWPSTGSSLGPVNTSTVMFTATPTSRIVIADVTGDASADAVQHEPSAGTWATAARTGDYFKADIIDIPTGFKRLAFKLQATPGGSLRCRIDNGSYTPCSQNYMTPNLSDGAHMLSVLATSATGVSQQIPTTATFRIGTGDVDTLIVDGPADGSTQRDPRATYSFFAEAGAAYMCQIDREPAFGCSSPYTTPRLADGRHTFSVYVSLGWFPLELTPAKRVVMIDGSEPVTKLTGGPDGQSVPIPTATFEFESEAGATFECSIDLGVFEPCSSPFTTPSLPDGDHELAIRARDSRETFESAPINVGWRVDTENPSTIRGSASGDGWLENASGGSTTRLSADVDADGRADAIEVSGALGLWSIARDVATNYQTPTTWIKSFGSGSAKNFAADVNADSQADAVVFEPSTNTWWVALSTGTTFGTPSIWRSGFGSSNATLLLADVTADGRADAVSIDSSTGTWNVAISSGTAFGTPTAWLNGFGSSTSQFFLAPLSGDAGADAVTFDIVTGQWRVAVASTSSFGAPATWANANLGLGATSTLLGDVSGDGKADIVSYFEDTNITQISLATANNFGTPSTWPTPSADAADELMVGKVEGGTRFGLIGFTKLTGVWTTWESTGTTFLPPVASISGFDGVAPKSAAGDVNGDGKDDAVLYVTGSDGVGRWHASMSRGSAADSLVDIGGGGLTLPVASNIFVEDVNGDARDDAVIQDSSNGDWWVSESTRAGLRAPVKWTTNLRGDFNHLADVNGDGRADAVVGFRIQGTFMNWNMRLSTGADFGSLQSLGMIRSTNVADRFFIGDVTGDGRGDLVQKIGTTGEWRVAPYDGTSMSTPDEPGVPKLWTESFGIGEEFANADLADVSGDGKADFIVRSTTDGTVGVLRSNGTGVVPEENGEDVRWESGFGVGASGVISADVNGDSKIDLLAFYQREGEWHTAVSNGARFSSTAPNGRGSGTIGFTANEDASFECRVDSGPYEPCSSPWTSPALSQGPHTLEVRATDSAGNFDSSPESFPLVVNPAQSAPNTTIVTGPSVDGYVAGTTAGFRISSDLPRTTFECRIDAASFAPCSSVFTSGTLSAGSHVFEARARAADGSVDPTPASSSFVVGGTTPDTTQVSGPTSGSTINSATPSFGFASNNPSASFECKIDAAAAFQACAASYSPTLAAGARSIQVRARDAMDNVDATPLVINITVDLTAPETTHALTYLWTNPLVATGVGATATTRMIGDVNADGRDDIVNHYNATGTWEVSLSSATGYGAETTWGGATATGADWRPMLGDVTGDGRADAVIVQVSTGLWRVASSSGTTFNTLTTWRTGYGVNAADYFVGDMTGGGDNRADAVYVTSGTAQWFVAPSTGTAFSTAAATTTAWSTNFGTGATRKIADVTGDGKADAVSFSSIGDISVSASTGTALQAGQLWKNVPNATFIPPLLADVNGDSKVDFMMSDVWATYTYLSTGSGTMTAATASNVAWGTAYYTGDANGDGKDDVFSFEAGDWGVSASAGNYPSAGLTPASQPSFKFTSEAGTTFECQLDDGSWAACTSPHKPSSPLADGGHKLLVRATDAVGNTDATPLTHRFRVNTPFNVSIVSGPSEGAKVNTATPTFEFASEPGAIFTCEVDYIATPCGSTFSTSPLSEGFHSLRVSATDSSGYTNAISSPQTTRSFTVDLTAPDTAYPSPYWNGPLAATGVGATATTRLIGDVNADGRDDIVNHYNTTGTWKVSLASATGYGPETTWGGATATGTDWRPMLADVTGEGRADAVIVQVSTGLWRVASSTGATFNTLTTWRTGYGVNAANYFVADMTGEGRADAVYVTSGTAQWFVAPSIGTSGTSFSTATSTTIAWSTNFGTSATRRIGDLTGDGRADAIAIGSNGDINVARSTGAALQASAVWSSGSVPMSAPLVIGDFNADGEFDIAAFTMGWSVYMSTGSTLTPSGTSSAAIGSNYYSGDANGDAKDDLISFDAGDWAVSASAGNYFSAGLIAASQPSFKFSSEIGATFQCQLDGGSWAGCASPYKPASPLANGSHKLLVRAVDAAGNADTTPLTHNFRVNTPLNVSIVSGPVQGSRINTATPTFELSADPGSTLTCVIDDVASACGSSVTTSPLSEGLHTFVVRVSDSTGYTEIPLTPQTTRNFTVDLTAPQTTYATSSPLGAPLAATGVGATATTRLIGDVNADGRDDIVNHYNTTGTWKVSLASATGYGAETTWGGATATGTDWRPMLGDVTGDGKADAVIVQASTGLWRVAASTGTTFNTLTTWRTGYGVNAADYFVGDMTGGGDGRADAVYVSSGGSQQWFVAPSTGTAFSTATSTTTAWSTSLGTNATRRIGDVTGDGKADAVVITSSGDILVAISTGAALQTGVLWRSAAISFGSSILLGDFNSDGKVDISGFDWLTMTLYHSTGSAFSPSGISVLPFGAGYYSGDANGDGKDDAFIFDGGNWAVATSIGTYLTTNVTPITQPSFRFSAEVGATFECQLDSGSWAACTAPYKPASPLTSGTHTVSVRAVDVAGNKDASPLTHIFRVSSPLDVSIDSGPANGSTINTNSPSWTFSSEPGVTYRCAIDGIDFPCGSTFNASGLTDGAHTMRVWPIDSFGYTEPWSNVASASRTFTVDTDPAHVVDKGAPSFGLATPLAAVDNGIGATTRLIGDVNADGRDDIVNHYNTTGTWKVSLASVTGYGPETTWGGATATGTDWRPMLADVTGEGRADAVIVQVSTGLWRVASSSGTTFNTLTTWRTGYGVNAADYFVGDMTGEGDGRADAVYVSSGGSQQWFVAPSLGTSFSSAAATTTAWSTSFGTNATRRIGDVTGDGKADAVASFADGRLEVANSSGTALSAAQQWNGAFGSTGLALGDFDGNGKSDFAATDARTVDLAISSGSGFSSRLSGSIPRGATILAGDVNVDGVDDLIALNSIGEVAVALSTSSDFSTTPFTSPKFSFDTTGSAALVECQIDNGPWTVCTSPTSASGLAVGPHRIRARATDAAGNVEPVPASGSFRVGPSLSTSITSGPANASSISTDQATFGFSSEAGASFECSVNGSPFAACASPFTATGLIGGTQEFQVRAVDSGGNRDRTPEQRYFTVDLAAPVVSVTAPIEGVTLASTVDVLFDVSGAISTTCRLDAGTATSCVSPHVFSSVPTGNHEVRVVATDAAGNVTTVVRSFSVNAGPPETSILSGPTQGGFSLTSTPAFTFGSNASPATFECTVDGGAYASCASGGITASLSDGAHTFYVRSIDQFSSVDPTPAERSFTVDTVAPNTSIASGPADGLQTLSTTATYGLASSEVDSTFECKLDAGAFASCGLAYTTPALAVGTHTIQVRATDAAGNTDGTPTQRTIEVVPAGAIDSFATAVLNFGVWLPDFGTIDWAHYGRDTVSSFNRKSSGGSPGISDYSLIGSGATTSMAQNTAAPLGWIDGAPIATQNPGTTNGIETGGALGRGFRITLPVTSSLRQIYVCTGVLGTTAKVRVSISDNSFTPFTDTSVSTASTTTPLFFFYGFRVRSGSANATVTIDVTQDTSAAAGKVHLFAATAGTV